MKYFNYHAQAKKLITANHLMCAEYVDKYRHISPALILYFDNHAPIPIRQYMWGQYEDIIKSCDMSVTDRRTVTKNTQD